VSYVRKKPLFILIRKDLSNVEFRKITMKINDLLKLNDPQMIRK